MKRIEHQHQVALFSWAKLMAAEYPELRLMYAIPNGGGRSKAQAGQLKAEGVKAGMPDVCLPVPRRGFCACYIELKRPAEPGHPEGRVSAVQRAVIAELEAAGNHVAVATGWDEARTVLMEYLG